MEILICFVEGRKRKLTLIYIAVNMIIILIITDSGFFPIAVIKREHSDQKQLRGCTGLDEDVPHWLRCLNT